MLTFQGFQRHIKSMILKLGLRDSCIKHNVARKVRLCRVAFGGLVLESNGHFQVTAKCCIFHSEVHVNLCTRQSIFSNPFFNTVCQGSLQGQPFFLSAWKCKWKIIVLISNAPCFHWGKNFSSRADYVLSLRKDFSNPWLLQGRDIR